jgi:hypothetical protein
MNAILMVMMAFLLGFGIWLGFAISPLWGIAAVALFLVLAFILGGRSDGSSRRRHDPFATYCGCDGCRGGL